MGIFDVFTNKYILVDQLIFQYIWIHHPNLLFHQRDREIYLLHQPRESVSTYVGTTNGTNGANLHVTEIDGFGFGRTV